MERTEVKPVARNPKSPTTSEDSDHFSFPEHGKKYAPRVFIFANRFLKCSSQTIKLMMQPKLITPSLRISGHLVLVNHLQELQGLQG